MAEQSTESPRTPAIVEDAIVELHPSGDVVLIVSESGGDKRRKKFLASSILLSAASTYFNTLFGPTFKEGQQAADGSRREINLEDDDPDAMEIILSVLHYKDFVRFERLDAEQLAAVAKQGDKYLCNSALKPWIPQWFAHLEKEGGNLKLGMLLVAAYFFGAGNAFENITARTVRELPRLFLSAWEEQPSLALLPSETRGKYSK